jgi:hypothetical protein
MEDPLALVLSDLHLGEESSILHYDSEQEANRSQQPAVARLTELIEKKVSKTPIPFLVLAGDTLDLSLASVQDSIADFRRFLRDTHYLFQSIVYIPGNHDHHLWCTLQEQVCVVNRIEEPNKEIKTFPHEQVGRIKEGELQLDNVGATGKFGAETFLTGLLPQSCPPKDFAVVYPNLYITFDRVGTEPRDIFITHGHFFEVVWTFVSDVFRKSLGITAINYRILERLNSPHTEFGWYGLGQAGKLSQFIEELYKELKNSEDRRLTRAIADLRDYIDELWTSKPAEGKRLWSGITGVFPGVEAHVRETSSDIALNVIAYFVKNLIISRVEKRGSYTGGSSLRHCSNILDDPAKKDRIEAYISHSFSRPYDFRPGRVIFGHTHSPFENGSIGPRFNGSSQDISVFNAGGWVVDSEDPSEIIQSRPMPFLISKSGDIERIDFPWPKTEDMAGKGKAGVMEVVAGPRKSVPVRRGRYPTREI